MKNIKKKLILLLILAMIMPTIASEVVAKDLLQSEYVPLDNGLKVKLIAQLNGPEGEAILGASGDKSCGIASQEAVFDNNANTKIVFRKLDYDWGGNLLVGDYIGVEFKETIVLRNIQFDMGNHGEDHFGNITLQVKTTSGEWIDLHTYSGSSVSNVNYTPSSAIANVTAVRLVNGMRKDNKWLHLYDIRVDGEVQLEEIADYLAVTQAIERAQSLDKTHYKGFEAVEAAIAVVDYNKTASEQAIVNGYADAINNALDNLVKVVHELNSKYIEIVDVGEQRSEQPVSNIFDGRQDTLWHTNWNGSSRDTHYFVLKVPENYYESIKMLPRASGGDGAQNGVITEVRVSVKYGEDAEWEEVVVQDGLNQDGWQYVEFNRGMRANYIKIEVLDAMSNSNNLYASLAELKINYGAEQLNRKNWQAVAYFSNGDNAEYTDNAQDYTINSGVDANEGPAEYMFDDSLTTKFHTDYAHASESYYKNPTSIILKLGKTEKFNYLYWLNRTDTESCRLSMFELYTIDDGQDYTDEQLKSDAPWVKKIATTAENKAYAQFYVGSQTTKYVKIVCKTGQAEGHLTCADLNLFYVPEEEMGEIIYSGINANLDSSKWIKESAYNQLREVKGYYGIVNGLANTFLNSEANLIRYIDSSVLSVKAQSLIDENGNVDVRFITSIASLNLEGLRFKIEVLQPGKEPRENYVNTHRVFKSIIADNVNISEASFVFGNNISTHFALCKLNNIPENIKDSQTKIIVTPYWAPKGVEIDDYENYVQGISREFDVKDLFDNASETKTISEVE